VSQFESPTAPPRPCPDCGAPNPPGQDRCVECNHPLDVPDARREGAVPPPPPAAEPAPVAPPQPATPPPPAAAAAPRVERPDRPERIGPNVTSWGYQPGRAGGGSSIPSWLWAAVGLAALGAVLVTAIQIAKQPPPIAIPGASKEQLASAESLRTLLRKDSTEAGPNTAFGNLYYDTGNFGDAVPYYRRALKTDPTLTDVRVDLGVAYHNMGDLASAQHELEEAVRIAPDHAIAQFDLAVVYQSMGRKEDARAHYLKAKSLDHPPEMAAVIDQLIDRLDHPAASAALPPGHPSVDGMPLGHPDVNGMPPDHPPVDGTTGGATGGGR
jgi:hypothetical protein